MKHLFCIIASFLLLSLTGLTGCEKENKVTLATVELVSITERTSNTAKIITKVTNEGNGVVTGTGVCWGEFLNPDLSDNVSNVGAGKGTFTSVLTGLKNNTTYHVRAFATNEKGTVYSRDYSFTTIR